jgi:hypothetical protein
MMTDDDDGEIGGMAIGRENRSTKRKPAPMPLCPISEVRRHPDCATGFQFIKFYAK